MDGSRRALVLVAAFTFIASFLVFGDTRQAFAKADCLQSDPKADVALSQTVTGPIDSTGDWLKQITLTNLGPCNVPDVVLVDTLPAGTAADVGFGNWYTSNPNSWSCDASAPGIVTCSPNSTMGVPGTAVISIRITAPSTSVTWTDKAQAILGGGSTPGSGCGDNNASTTCDPATANNTNWAANVAAGGDALTVCAASKKDINNNDVCVQKMDVSVPPTGQGGSGQVQNLSDAKTTCAAITGFRNCFGTVVSMSSTAIRGALKTFTVSASLTSQSYGQVDLINSTNGSAWAVVPSCDKNATVKPCVLSKSKYTDATGTYYVFQVLTDFDDSWGFE